MSVMVVPNRRIRGIGHFLGQEGVYDPRLAVWAQPKPTKPDMDHVITMEELSSVSFANADEAFNYYRYIVLAVAIQTKVAFMVDLWKTIKTSPEVVGAMAVTEDGRAWLEAFTNCEGAFLSFTQPNYFQSLNLIRNHLEVNILPKTYGIGVKGRLPMFIKGATELSYSDVSVGGLNVKATYDFGNLQKSALKDDVKKADELADYFKVRPKLGAIPLAAIVVISITAVIITGFLYAAWVDYLETRKIPQEVKDAIKKADPATVERILDKWSKMGGLFGGVADIFMWGAIGLGVIVVGGTILYIATK